MSLSFDFAMIDLKGNKSSKSSVLIHVLQSTPELSRS